MVIQNKTDRSNWIKRMFCNMYTDPSRELPTPVRTIAKVGKEVWKSENTQISSLESCIQVTCTSSHPPRFESYTDFSSAAFAAVWCRNREPPLRAHSIHPLVLLHSPAIMRAILPLLFLPLFLSSAQAAPTIPSNHTTTLTPPTALLLQPTSPIPPKWSCTIKAWVRAPDLSPNLLVSSADARLKANGTDCDDIVKWEVGLRFKERGVVRLA